MDHFSMAQNFGPRRRWKTMEQQPCDQTQEIRVRGPFVDLVENLCWVEAMVPWCHGGSDRLAVVGWEKTELA